MQAKRIHTLFPMLGLALVLAGCEKQAGNGTAQKSEKSAAAVPDELFLADAPEDGRSVAAVKADRDAKGEVVVHGRIGGRVEPFVPGAAVFLLADVSMRPCNELPGDTCTTPWDYCCEPRESLAAQTATIQVVGADGRPLRVDLKGEQGLAPLAEVTVVGEVQPRAGTDTLVVNAREIYVHPADG